MVPARTAAGALLASACCCEMPCCTCSQQAGRAVQTAGRPFSSSQTLNAGSPATLHEVALQVPAGSLVMVVGPVWAGKRLLLHALLGELHCTGSGAVVAGSVAYAAQDPFITNQTLRAQALTLPSCSCNCAGHLRKDMHEHAGVQVSLQC